MKTLLTNLSIRVQSTAPEHLSCDALVVPVFKEDSTPSYLKELDHKLKGRLKVGMDLDRFEGEAEKTLWIDAPNVGAKRILLLGLGPRKEVTRTSIRDAFAVASKTLPEKKVERVGVLLASDKNLEPDFDAALEGFLLATYRFDHYRSDPKDKKKNLKLLTFSVKDSSTAKKVTQILDRTKAIVHSVFLARDLINEPANVSTPALMTAMAAAIAKEQKLKLKVIGEVELQKRNMNLLLAVGMGSVKRPRLVHLEYKPKGKAKQKVALVGKGVTFDSGGLSLKPQANMYGMKCDMSGSAAVLAAMWAVAELELPVHVHGILPLVENMPSAHSVRPGDVFIAANGKSVEIENTDAEGRLILADAMNYVTSELDVDCMIDAATLTGACVVALGEDISAAMGTNEKLISRILKAGERVGEKFWELPLEKSYARMLKSDVADLKNVGGKYAGAITAGLFLKEFAGEKPWVHLDIAGPAYVERESSLGPKGATGFAVRTFLEVLASF